MKPLALLALLSLALLLPLPCLGRPGELVLFADGRSAYSIVLPDTPTQEERQAAGELRKYFLEVTGVELPLLPQSQWRSPAFCLGWTPQAEAFLGCRKEEMGRDQVLLRSNASGDIFLTGEPGQGIQYAVYLFLEEWLGLRWWGWGEEYIPDAGQRLAIPPLDLDYTPPFLDRVATASIFHEPTRTLCQKLRTSLLTPSPTARAERTYLEITHTMELLLPDEASLKAHPGLYDPENPPASKPEFYALREGRRLGAGSQPCMTDPEAFRQLLQNLKTLLRKNMPDCQVVWVTQNDNTAVCECPRCLEAVDRLGNRADLNIDFMNRLAEALQEDFPGIAVETFAYQFTLDPPRTVRPSDHVHVRVCLIEASNAHPLTHPINRPYLEALKGWAAICSHVNVWHYTVNFTNFGLCHPTTAILAQDIRLFHELKVRKVLSQDGGDMGELGWFTPYRQSLIAHCLWNPRLDIGEFTRDFFQKYYGPAAPPLLELLDLFQETATASPWPMPCYMMDTGRWLPLETLEQGTRLVQQALDLAKDSPNPDHLRRTALLETTMQWARLWRVENTCLNAVTRRAPAVPQAELLPTLQELETRLATVRKTPSWKYMYSKMGTRLERHLQLLRNQLTPEPPHRKLPPQLAGTPPQSLVLIPREMYQIDASAYVNDAKAPVPHSSVRLPLAGSHWRMRIDLPAIAQAGAWEAFAEVRLPDAVHSPAGTAALAGFYTYGTNFAEVTRVPLPALALSREEYRLVSLGTVDFHRDYQIYFSGCDNPSVPELLVGRIFLKRLSLPPATQP